MYESSPINCLLPNVTAIFQFKAKGIYKLRSVILYGKVITLHNKLIVKEQLFFYI